MAQRGRNEPAGRFGIVALLIALVVLLWVLRFGSSVVIEYRWWQELGQVETWLSMAAYRFLPGAGTALLAFVIWWTAHARALKFAGTGLREWPRYSRIASIVLAVVALLFATI